MASVTIEEAQAKLPQLLDAMNPGEEIAITEGGSPWRKSRNRRGHRGHARRVAIARRSFGCRRFRRAAGCNSRNTWNDLPGRGTS